MFCTISLPLLINKGFWLISKELQKILFGSSHRQNCKKEKKTVACDNDTSYDV